MRILRIRIPNTSRKIWYTTYVEKYVVFTKTYGVKNIFTIVKFFLEKAFYFRCREARKLLEGNVKQNGIFFAMILANRWSSPLSSGC
jgi:hypothetical protein